MIRAAARRFLRSPNGFPGKDFRLGQIGGRERGQRQQVAPEYFDRLARQETPAAGGHHDRIHHQRNATVLTEEAGHFTNNRAGTQHSRLDRRRGRPGKDGLDLRAHHPGRARFNAGDYPGVLGREAGNGTGPMHTQRRKSLEIGLNARPAAAVRAGDRQGDGDEFDLWHLRSGLRLRSRERNRHLKTW